MKDRDSIKFRPRKVERDSIQKRAEQSASDFVTIFKDKYNVYKVQNKNVLRILPVDQDWGLEHYGMEVYVHYNVGADTESYLCLDKMKRERCPICEAAAAAQKSGDAEFAKTLKPSKRVVVWALDRETKELAPVLWNMPWTIDRDIADRCVDKISGEVLDITDLDEGFDVSFSREGQGLKTKYIGIDIARRPSPVCRDDRDLEEVVEFLVNNPLPDVLKYYSYEEINHSFTGTVIPKEGKVESEFGDSGKSESSFSYDSPGDNDSDSDDRAALRNRLNSRRGG